MRRTLGVLLAALTTTVAFAIVLFVLSWAVQGPTLVPLRVVGAALPGLYALFALPPAIVVAFALGLPLALRLERRGAFELRPYVLLGAALGVAPFVLFDLYVVGYEIVAALRHGPGAPATGLSATLAREVRAAPRAAAWLVIGGLCGMASAAVYWVVAVRRSS